MQLSSYEMFKAMENLCMDYGFNWEGEFFYHGRLHLPVEYTKLMMGHFKRELQKTLAEGGWTARNLYRRWVFCFSEREAFDMLGWLPVALPEGFNVS